MSTRHPAVDAILAVLPMDGTGHVADCGYDEADTCGCSSLPTRLDAIVRDHVAAALNEVRRAIDTELGSLRARVNTDYTDALVTAARIVRAAANGP